ncbi:MAG: hypothetical protein COX57_03005 [Alphaproteobacteria bacterium CG_4_10_14_0_2_um_filter_63_37]|nr:MAG: hypothetical protein COX57_03005 [Alphaproteobacteria bacterium CG_4_10_14_0_2_um_filter_63_37]
MANLGYAWLQEHLALPRLPLHHTSRLGTRLKSETLPDGRHIDEYPAQYQPGDDPIAHLVFALKYDGIDLAVLQQVFQALDPTEVAAAIDRQPNSKYLRQIGFLYEFLLGRTLPVAATIGGRYLPLLDPQIYVVGPVDIGWVTRRDPRWKIDNNLLGTPEYCPIVRRTSALAERMARDPRPRIESLIADFPPALFQRANDYLYLKETRSSYGIEHETPAPQRAERFVELLRSAGDEPFETLMEEATLTTLQGAIVDPRYAQAGFRSWQNYVGQTRPGYSSSQILHYVCPPPELVPSLMRGLARCAQTGQGIHPIVHATVVAFGFVFIHPFEDGNGRLHRFLIHDFLRRGGVAPAGVMLPVSAAMLRRMGDYDAALEAYSAPLAPLLRTTLDDEARLTINNPQEVEGYYRYPDLTRQAEYLCDTVAYAVEEDLAEELRFLAGYDNARRAMQEVVDMPDRRLELFIQLLHQNGGKLSNSKRGTFQELSAAEIAALEEAYVAAFGANAP